MTYWIIGTDGQSYGPAELETVRRWVGERRVIGTTPVARSADGPWQDAALVPELARAFGEEPGAEDPQAGPAPGAAPPTQPQASATPVGWPPQAVSIPQLVSGILNLVCAVSWLTTCFGIVIALPVGFLGIKELIAYSRATTLPPGKYLERTKTMAVLDICTVLALNVPSMVCGIVMLTQIPAARDRLARS